MREIWRGKLGSQQNNRTIWRLVTKLKSEDYASLPFANPQMVGKEEEESQFEDFGLKEFRAAEQPAEPETVKTPPRAPEEHLDMEIMLGRASS